MTPSVMFFLFSLLLSLCGAMFSTDSDINKDIVNFDVLPKIVNASELSDYKWDLFKKAFSRAQIEHERKSLVVMFWPVWILTMVVAGILALGWMIISNLTSGYQKSYWLSEDFASLLLCLAGILILMCPTYFRFRVFLLRVRDRKLNTSS